MNRHGLERLGHHIVSRRVAVGYRNRTDFADSLHFSVRTLSDIENGVMQGQLGHLCHGRPLLGVPEPMVMWAREAKTN
jgi:hypothetical protein